MLFYRGQLYSCYERKPSHAGHLNGVYQGLILQLGIYSKSQASAVHLGFLATGEGGELGELWSCFGKQWQQWVTIKDYKSIYYIIVYV